MNLKELQRELDDTRAAIEHKQKDLDFYKNLEKSLLEQIENYENPMMVATDLWCRITNALISKYKVMTEKNPERAVEELNRLEGSLLADGFISQEELDQAL